MKAFQILISKLLRCFDSFLKTDLLQKEMGAEYYKRHATETKPTKHQGRIHRWASAPGYDRMALIRMSLLEKFHFASGGTKRGSV